MSSLSLPFSFIFLRNSKIYRVESIYRLIRVTNREINRQRHRIFINEIEIGTTLRENALNMK